MSGLAICGLGRCGTTALMTMLDAAGVPVAGEPPAYEPDTVATQREYEGRAFKVLDLHLTSLRPERVLWLRRDFEQQAISGGRFVGRELARSERKRFAASLRRDTLKCRRLLRRAGSHVDELRFEDVLASPRVAARVLARVVADAGLGTSFDLDAAVAAVHRREPEALAVPWEHTL